MEIKDLSSVALKDLERYQTSGEDAIYMLAQSAFDNGEELNTDMVLNRIQSKKIYDIQSSSNTKSDLKKSLDFIGAQTQEDWKKMGVPCKKIKESATTILNNKYSCYFLKAETYNQLRYPMYDSFTSSKFLFRNKTFPNYEELVNKVKKSFGIKVIEASGKNKLIDKSELYRYIKENKFVGFVKNVGLGAVNLCRTLFKKSKLFSTKSYRGKIILRDNYVYAHGGNYKLSQQEKFVKILDGILNVTIKRATKVYDSNLNEKQLFYSRLYANILLSRAINFNDKGESNKKIENSLMLQMANVLAGLNMTTSEINQATSIAFKSAIFVINKMGIEISDIKACVKNMGYKYDKNPTTIDEALLPKSPLLNLLLTSGEEEVVEQEQKTEQNFILKGKPYNSVSTADYNQNKKENNELIQDVEYEVLNDESTKYAVKKPMFLNPAVYYISKNSAEMYIDNVIESGFKKLINKNLGKINLAPESNKKAEKLHRGYNFAEHMLAFYRTNKNKSAEELDRMIEKEFSSNKTNDDNKYAHSLSKAFINLKQQILNGIFGDANRVEKKQNKKASVLVNEYVENKYGKKLVYYIYNCLDENLNKVYKEIDKNSFVPRNFTENTLN